jgi:hypothetical protein
MSKPLVYLAKSNLVDVNHLITVHTLLKNYDCDVIEWDPSNDRLLQARFLLVMTEAVIPTEKCYFVGRGIYGQISNFMQKLALDDVKEDRIFIVHQSKTKDSFSMGEIMVNEFDDIAIYDTKDWKQRYGQLRVEEPEIMLSKILPVKTSDRRFIGKK